MKEDSLWTEDNEILHIYSPQYYHCDVKIVGTLKALEKLRDQLNEILKYNQEHSGGILATNDYLVNDGEGYELTVELRRAEWMEMEPQPYTDTKACPGSYLNKKGDK